jgi:hypothetical protein
MSAPFRRLCAAGFVGVALLLCQAEPAHAHPLLAGKWIAALPSGGIQVYEFGCGEYLGNGIWRGSAVFYVSNCPVWSGEYELRMFTGDAGTLSLLSTSKSIYSNVGLVDFGAAKRPATFSFMGVVYRR